MCRRLQRDGTKEMPITMKGKGDKENIVLRGADRSLRVIQVKHDFHIFEVCPSYHQLVHLVAHMFTLQGRLGDA